jgi:sRNA-binding protein
VIAARRAARYEAVRAVLQDLMARWPQTFTLYPEPVRPLARGIGKVVTAQLPHGSRRLVSDAIAFWQRLRKTPYLQALIAGGPRYDLEGNPQDEVTPEQQAQARKDLAAWRAYRQEKRGTRPNGIALLPHGMEGTMALPSRFRKLRVTRY